MEKKVRRILVPVDGSDAAGRAAELAAELAEALGANVTLLHVVEVTGAAEIGLTALTAEEFETMKVRSSEAAMQTARSHMELSGNRIEWKTAVGDPPVEILHQAKACNADLIVMGTRGQSALRELVLGSVSDKVVRHSKCAVTVVH